MINENEDIENRIKDVLTRFGMLFLEKSNPEDDDIQILLDAYREILEVDTVFLCEAGIDINSFTFTHVSDDNFAKDMFGKKYETYADIHFEKEMIYENVISDLKGEKISVILYGIADENECHGAAGILVRDVKREWTDVERESIRRLGRACSLYVKYSRMKKLEMQDKDKNAIIEALGKGYISAFIIDWDTYDIRLFKTDMQKSEEVSLKTINCRNVVEARSFYVNSIVHEEDREMFFKKTEPELIKEKIKNKEKYGVTFRRAYNGEVFYCRAEYDMVQLENGKKIIVMAFRDVNDIVEREIEQAKLLAEALKQAKTASEAKTTFLFNMSHDIRTPMNAILGFTDIAQKYIDDNKKTKDCLEKIKISGEYLLKLINDVLDMAQIEQGKLIINEKNMNLLEWNEKIIDMYRNDITARNLNFKTTVDVDDCLVMADALRIGQIVTNLLSNAMKFTKENGHIEYVFKQLSKEENGCVTYEIRIKDDGIGMCEEFQMHMFEQFARERNSTHSKVQGTGLGLAIIKQIIETMGGTIEVKSAINVGTEFIISFPLKLQKNEDVQVSIENDAEFDFKGIKILLVEDNELNREIAVDILEEAGFEVDIAEDGTVAIEKIKIVGFDNYDLVLMDIQMPFMDGFEATTIIREMERNSEKKLPIIAMTANAFDEDRKKAVECGMNDHVPKPIDVPKLLMSIRNVLK